MANEPIYDNSNVLILNNQGATIDASRSAIRPTYTDEFETFLRSTGETREVYVKAIFKVFNELRVRALDGNLLRFYPINNRTTQSSLVEYHNISDLSVAGGDIDHEFNGLAGDGASVYYDVGSDGMNALITDINNFSIGIYSQTDDDIGTDFGASTGTNFVTIACKSGGELIVKVGTTTVSGAVNEGSGHNILNVQSATVKAWHSKGKVLTEIASGAIGGILPTDPPFMCAENDDGTAVDHSSKRISCLWVYDGELNDAGVSMMDQLIENYMLVTGNSVNYGA